MSQRYSFEDDSGDVRLSGFLDPDPVPAGLSPGIVYQTGSGSPIGAVTPTQIGSVYQDLAPNGGLYVATGATSADWTLVGGVGDYTAGGVLTTTSGTVRVIGRGSHVAMLTCAAALNGSGNAIQFDPTAGDGLEVIFFDLGANGLYRHLWGADGSYSLPAPAQHANDATRLSQLSPKFTITSGALSTVQLVTATGAQILTTRDAETITPCTFNPGAATTATITAALSPDNVTYSTLGVETVPAGVALDGTIHLVKVRVPAAWYLKLTVNAQAVLGLTTYY